MVPPRWLEHLVPALRRLLEARPKRLADKGFGPVFAEIQAPTRPLLRLAGGIGDYVLVVLAQFADKKHSFVPVSK